MWSKTRKHLFVTIFTANFLLILVVYLLPLYLISRLLYSFVFKHDCNTCRGLLNFMLYSVIYSESNF